MDKYEKVLSSNICAISFFSGCGGLDIGVQLGGAKIISSLDFEPAAISTLKSNKFFSHSFHECADIRTKNGLDYNSIISSNNPEKLIIVGGPPCQPFSKAGYWITNEKRKGIDDERNMVYEYLRLIEEIRPDGVILENVESMLHPTNKAIADYIRENLERMGYYVKCSLINALSLGIPQKRKRVIFLASRKPFDKEIQFLPDESITQVNVLDWIGRFDSSVYCEPEELTSGKTYDFELTEVPPGHNYIALSERDGYPNPKFIANKRFWNFLLKLHPQQPSWTIAAQPGPWVGPFHWTNRRLRVKEIASIQTFPIDYNFQGTRRAIQKQIGNAVPCLFGKAVTEFLISQL
jgi:DNA (cytosine-5)-methyltransferase 1